MRCNRRDGLLGLSKQVHYADAFHKFGTRRRLPAADCLAMSMSFLHINGVIGNSAFLDEAEKTFKIDPLLCTVRIWDAVKRRNMERAGVFLGEAESLFQRRHAARKDWASLAVACGGAALFAGNCAYVMSNVRAWNCLP